MFTKTEETNFTVVSFEIPGGILAPSDLPALQPPAVDGSKGVVLDGRGPVWLYAFLTHHYHATAWVGVNSPRDGGAVVVERHTSSAPAVGAIVPLPKG